MKKLLTGLLLTALAGLLLPGCTSKQLAAEHCVNYRDSGAQSQARLISDITTGYPIVRIFCTHNDAVAWAENVIERAKTGEKPVEQLELTTDLIQTAGALVLLPVEQRTLLINAYPAEKRSALLALTIALNKLRTE